jgi:nitroimidazol reductase NimA-like FMN-containing flavoprotein (pyridoxamine 5'-phosphate oxidase superfamily)
MPSRRNSIELTDQERRDFIDGAKTLIIVSNGRNGFPHPMPMWFYRDGEDRLWCTTFSKAQKVLNYQRDNKAALLVESGQEYAELKGVVIYAETKIVADTAVVADVLVNINSRGRSLNEEQRNQLRAAVTKTAEKRVALCFTPKQYVSWDHRKLGGKY